VEREGRWSRQVEGDEFVPRRTVGDQGRAVDASGDETNPTSKKESMVGIAMKLFLDEKRSAVPLFLHGMSSWCPAS
jgi:hypothetical protein